jgi:NADH-quinone oxidoreductase subunit N
VSHLNVTAAVPLLITSGVGVAAMGVGLLPGRFARRHGPTVLAAGGLVAAAVMSLVLWGDRQEAFSGGLRADRFSLLFNLIFLTAALATLLLGARDPAAVDRRGEFAGLLLISTTGMMLVAGAGDLISIFLGIEILSVSLYVLCALEVWRVRSLESGLKYLIIGSIGSAILLYGLAMLFGAVGATDLDAIAAALAGTDLLDEPLVLAALALIVSGLAFKASAAPFHMWTPDVYEGAPTTVSAFMSTATKAAAFAAFLRLFAGALPDLRPDWQVAIAAVAVASIVIGNVAALVQRNMKRLLAYSSIAQAGYLLIGVAAGTIRGAEATLYYLLAYGAMTLAAFAVVVVREREVEDGDEIDALAGYGRARPVLGAVMAVSMLSLAGFPPLSGFIGKFLVFGSAVESDLTWLAIVGAVGSMVSLAYYLRVVAVVWLSRPPGADAAPARVLRVPGAVGITTVMSGVAVIALSLMASPVLDACRGAAEALLAP